MTVTTGNICRSCIFCQVVGKPFYGPSGKGDMFCNRWGDICSWGFECEEYKQGYSLSVKVSGSRMITNMEEF